MIVTALSLLIFPQSSRMLNHIQKEILNARRKQFPLLKLNKSQAALGGNFIEGMACVGGCINGAGCLTHSEIKNKADVDKYGREAREKTITDAISIL